MEIIGGYQSVRKLTRGGCGDTVEDDNADQHQDQLEGTVLEVKKGPIDAIVTLEISEGNRITAVIPADAVEKLSLTASIPAYAIVSAYVVMLGVDPSEQVWD